MPSLGLGLSISMLSLGSTSVGAVGANKILVQVNETPNKLYRYNLDGSGEESFDADFTWSERTDIIWSPALELYVFSKSGGNHVFTRDADFLNEQQVSPFIGADIAHLREGADGLIYFSRYTGTASFRYFGYLTDFENPEWTRVDIVANRGPIELDTANNKYWCGFHPDPASDDRIFYRQLNPDAGINSYDFDTHDIFDEPRKLTVDLAGDRLFVADNDGEILEFQASDLSLGVQNSIMSPQANDILDLWYNPGDSHLYGVTSDNKIWRLDVSIELDPSPYPYTYGTDEEVLKDFGATPVFGISLATI